MNEYIPPDFQVPGFLAAGMAAGIKKTRAKDFAFLFSEDPATAAGAFESQRPESSI